MPSRMQATVDAMEAAFKAGYEAGFSDGYNDTDNTPKWLTAWTYWINPSLKKPT